MITRMDRDIGRLVDLLQARGIERRTLHRAYEILIIDNESQDPETLEYLARSPHRVVPFATPGGFSFADIVNFGVAQTNWWAMGGCRGWVQWAPNCCILTHGFSTPVSYSASTG